MLPGIKLKSEDNNRNYISLLSICFVIYFVSDYFLDGAVFYLIGGLLGTLFKLFGLKTGFYFLWITLLIASITLFYKIQNKVIKYSAIVIIWFLLYFIDAILYEVMPDFTRNIIRYLHMGLAILLKSVILVWIFYR